MGAHNSIIFATFAAQTIHTMKDFELYRLRSVGAIIRDGYRLYMDNFRRIFRNTWFIVLLYAVSSGSMTAWFVNTFPKMMLMTAGVDNQKDFLMTTGLVSLGVAIATIIINIILAASGCSLLNAHRETGAIPVPSKWYGYMDRQTLIRTITAYAVALLVFTLYGGCIGVAFGLLKGYLSMVALGVLMLLFIISALIIIPPVTMYMLNRILSPKGEQLKKGIFHPRYWGALYVVTLSVIIVSSLLALITELPANILVMANMHSLTGLLQGDPSGMPDYVEWLNLVVFILANFIQAYVYLSMFFPFYYLYGSVQAQEKERSELII